LVHVRSGGKEEKKRKHVKGFERRLFHGGKGNGEGKMEGESASRPSLQQEGKRKREKKQRKGKERKGGVIY